jgi:hypothetical protein
MRSFGKHAWLLLGLGLLAVPLVGVALSYACTGLATLSLTPVSALAGSGVTVTGKGFTAHDPSDARTGQAAQLRLDSLSSPLLGTAAPGADGAFSVRITVPRVTPGDHVIIATQNTSDGTPSYGTPARQVLKVVAPAVPTGSGGGSSVAPTDLARTLERFVTPTLSMSSARRAARQRIRHRSSRARHIRASCARRTRTTAVCLVRWKVATRAFKKRLVVRSHSVAG